MTKHHFFNKKCIKVFSETNARFEIPILITHGFSLLSLASLTDVFDAIGTIGHQEQVRVRLVSVDGQPVQARSGGRILPDGSLDSLGPVQGVFSAKDAIVICSGPVLSDCEHAATMKVVRRCRQSATPICIMGGAVRTVARAGKLAKGTDLWTRLPANSEMLPHMEFSNAIFVKDGNVVTCSGELGAMDFALNWVSENLSTGVAAKIRNHLLASSSRSADRAQTCTVPDTYKSAPKQLQDIIAIMVDNLEEPLSMAVVARKVGLSVRQVERLFARYLSTSPVKFYRAKQYEQARVLIEDTNMTVTEVALACGFSSFSAFGRGFRKQFGIAPTRLRSMHQPLV